MAKRLRRSCKHGNLCEECEDCCMMDVSSSISKQAYFTINNTNANAMLDDSHRRRKTMVGLGVGGATIRQDHQQQCCMFAHSLPARKAMRYNNIRLSDDAMFSRVPERLYPDAARYGWKFTGSCQTGRAEFFEKETEVGTILLDFFFTTGTIKVVLVHLKENLNVDDDEEIQLFAKGRSLLPDLYVKVLQNPLMNTDMKYRRRM